MDSKDSKDAKAATPAVRGVVVLTDQRVAKIVRKANGRDLEKGAAAASNPSNPMALMMGVAAQVITIDDKPVVYDDVLDLDLEDVLEIISEVLGGNGRAASLLSAIKS